MSWRGRLRLLRALLGAALWVGCASGCAGTDGALGSVSSADATPGAAADGGALDATTPDGGPGDARAPDAGAGQAGPFADKVGSFTPGKGAGWGQDKMPAVVLGGPEGKGSTSGSLHVVSLGCGGSLVLELTDTVLVDGPGVDLIVFENPFPGWLELAEVAVSQDGVDWHTWPCAKDDKDGGYPGCAGVKPVLANSANGVDPTDPDAAGGDAFDLNALGVAEARYVRVTDLATQACDPPSAGFDLDAIAVVNGKPAP